MSLIRTAPLAATLALAIIAGAGWSAAVSNATNAANAVTAPEPDRADDTTDGIPGDVDPAHSFARLRLDSRVRGVSSDDGRSEQLAIDFDVHSLFPGSADAAIAFHLTDNLGRTVRPPSNEVVTRGMASDATAVRSYLTPADLPDGHYRLEAMAAGLGDDGNAETVIHERFFRVRGGQVEPLDFDQWFPTAHESAPVLDDNDPERSER